MDRDDILNCFGSAGQFPGQAPGCLDGGVRVRLAGPGAAYGADGQHERQVSLAQRAARKLSTSP